MVHPARPSVEGAHRQQLRPEIRAEYDVRRKADNDDSHVGKLGNAPALRGHGETLPSDLNQATLNVRRKRAHPGIVDREHGLEGKTLVGVPEQHPPAMQKLVFCI